MPHCHPGVVLLFAAIDAEILGSNHKKTYLHPKFKLYTDKFLVSTIAVFAVISKRYQYRKINKERGSASKLSKRSIP
jgi:hypothetical protein